MPKRKEHNTLQISTSSELDHFIEQVRNAPTLASTNNKGRILFGLDATASRERTWDHASQVQNEMFSAADALQGLALKLCYFRGFNDFYASEWFSSSTPLSALMAEVSCMAGHTQIAKVLKQALNDTRKKPIQAVIFVGDCCEESADTLCNLAGELGLLNTPVFVFQEGNELEAKRIMKDIARLSGGAYHPFSYESADLLTELLKAVAVYASGGKKALEHHAKSRHPIAYNLLEQLKP